MGFPIDALHSAMNVMVIKIRKTEARCDFEDIPRERTRLPSFMMKIWTVSLTPTGWNSKGRLRFSNDVKALLAGLRSLPPASSTTGNPGSDDQLALLIFLDTKLSGLLKASLNILRFTKY